MADIYVDPWLLGIPKAASKADVADQYVQALTDLHALALGCGLVGAVTAYASDLLERDGLFPMVERMDSAVWPHRKDILRLVGAILGRLPSVEDDDCIQSVLIDDFSLPDLDSHPCRSDAANQHRKELLARSLCHSDRLLAQSGPAVLTPLETDFLGECRVACRIEDSDVCPQRQVPNGDFEGDVLIARCPKALASQVNAVDLWVDGRHSDALMLIVFQMTPASNRQWPMHVGKWSWGAHFMESVAKFHFDRERPKCEKLLRACVECVLGLRLADVHELRTNKGGNSHQRQRKADQALAWRRDIDYEFHLHFWKVNGHVEFGAVVVHNDFEIPE